MLNIINNKGIEENIGYGFRSYVLVRVEIKEGNKRI
jgi:hypothetical protein